MKKKEILFEFNDAGVWRIKNESALSKKAVRKVKELLANFTIKDVLDGVRINDINAFGEVVENADKLIAKLDEICQMAQQLHQATANNSVFNHTYENLHSQRQDAIRALSIAERAFTLMGLAQNKYKAYEEEVNRLIEFNSAYHENYQWVRELTGEVTARGYMYRVYEKKEYIFPVLGINEPDGDPVSHYIPHEEERIMQLFINKTVSKLRAQDELEGAMFRCIYAVRETYIHGYISAVLKKLDECKNKLTSVNAEYLPFVSFLPGSYCELEKCRNMLQLFNSAQADSLKEAYNLLRR